MEKRGMDDAAMIKIKMIIFNRFIVKIVLLKKFVTKLRFKVIL